MRRALTVVRIALVAALWGLTSDRTAADDTRAGQGGGIGDAQFVLGLTPNYGSTYGGGNFGAWTVDAAGLPAYQYQNGSNADRQVFSAERPYHLLGNSGSLAHSYSDGYHALFSARTFARYANYFRPERQAWSGGFGWVHDRSLGETWSTYFPEARDTSRFETTWGIGYARKLVERKQVEVVEDTFSPVGDDEVILQRITITNKSSQAKNLSYYSYWDWDSYIMQASLLAGNTPYYEDEDYIVSCDPARQTLKAAIAAPGGDLRIPNDVFDPSVRTAFFSMLNTDMTGYEMVKDNVFSPGQRTPVPDRLRVNGLIRSGARCDNVPGLITYNSRDMLFVAEKRFDLAPGASRALYTLYGFARKGSENAVIDRYRSNHAGRFDEMREHFARTSARFTPPTAADSWLTREVAWDAYHLNAGVVREDWFGTRTPEHLAAGTPPDGRVGIHTLNQNSQYLLDSGQNIAPRDNVQHIQPLIYSNPAIAKETLQYVLRNMWPNGELPFGSAGYGEIAAISSLPSPAGWRPSDLGLWLAAGIAEYVHATRDFGFLDERNLYRKRNQRDAEQAATVYEMLKASLRYQIQDVAKGTHQLVRIRTSDWADGLTGESGNEPATHERGESTFTTALALVAYPLARTLAERRADAALVQQLDAEIGVLSGALDAQWKGSMYNRAWLVDPAGNLVELGGDVFWAESNAFALLREDKRLPADRLERLLDLLQNPAARAITPLGLNITAQVPAGYSSTLRVRPGNTTWYSLSGAFVRGMAKHAAISPRAKALAWDELKRNTLANHAALYPSQFYGLTSGSDSWFTETNNLAPATDKPGTTWLERPLARLFPNGYSDKTHPINNMHSHSHLVYNTLQLAGIHATAQGYVIEPAMPADHGFGWESQTFGIRYEANRISGKIRPVASDNVTVKVSLHPQLRTASNLTVRVNGTTVSAQRADNSLSFPVALAANQTSVWSIEAAN